MRDWVVRSTGCRAGGEEFARFMQEYRYSVIICNGPFAIHSLMPRPAGSAEDLEERRRRGLALLDTGLSMHEVGRILDVAPSSVMRWSKARDQFGDDGLKIRFSTGRPARLKAQEHARMLRLLKQGARSHGFDSDRWTIERVGELIRREFGVEYQKTAVHGLLAKMGWEFRPPDLWCPAETP